MKKKPEQIEAVGRAAYESFSEGVAFTPTSWENLPSNLQARWIRIAYAAVDAYIKGKRAPIL